MGKTALILGATGLTGSLVLNKLLEDDRYSEVKVLARRTTNVNHPKLIEKIGDVLELDQYIDFIKGDEMYICIGTTKNKTPDKELYRKIDFGIPSKAAEICMRNKIGKIAVVSAIGANANSNILYNKLKGEMENKVLNAKIPKSYILRPSLISGNRKNDFRFGERVGLALFSSLSFLIPAKYKMTKAESIADRMIELCNSSTSSKILEAEQI